MSIHANIATVYIYIYIIYIYIYIYILYTIIDCFKSCQSFVVSFHICTNYRI